MKKSKTTADEKIQRIDEERDKLDEKALTPVTSEKFKAWLKKRKIRLDKERQVRIDQDFKELGIKTNKKKLTGKELFLKKQQIFKDAEDAMEVYAKEENVEIDQEAFEDEELPNF